MKRACMAVLALCLLAAAPPLVSFPDARAIDARAMALRMLDAATIARVARGELVPPPLDIASARERFVVTVPATMPPGGYGLFVYISPIDQPSLPLGWTAAINRGGAIVVSAADSGNLHGAFVRRAPLALLGAQAVMAHYRIDPARVMIGGFSGGSRVALKLALAYPDLFKGALLDAGSDVIGSDDLPMPPEAQLADARQNRFVLLSGANDSASLMNDRAARALRAVGVTHVYVREMENLGHSAAPPGDVRAALAFLDKASRTARSR